jgi:hypothetical protein
MSEEKPPQLSGVLSKLPESPLKLSEETIHNLREIQAALRRLNELPGIGMKVFREIHDGIRVFREHVAQLAPGEEIDWTLLWSIARYDLGLTNEEFLELTPRQMDALIKRRLAELKGHAITTRGRPRHAAQAAAGYPEKIIFRRLRDGTAVAERPFTDDALRNTYKSFSKTLSQVRALVIEKKGEILVRELRKNFADTELGKAAADSDWKGWITDFAFAKHPEKAAALVFLEGKTGLTRKTLKTRFTKGKNRTSRTN